MEAGEEGRALQPEFWASREACIVCRSDAFQPGYGPQTMVTCECCLDNGVHVECWQRRSGELLTQERLEQPGFEWFCSEVRQVWRPPSSPPSEAAAAAAPCRQRRETSFQAPLLGGAAVHLTLLPFATAAGLPAGQRAVG